MTFRKEEVQMVIVIKHNGCLFRSNEHAVLLATGITHHIVLLLKQ